MKIVSAVLGIVSKVVVQVVEDIIQKRMRKEQNEGN
jgi:hypothetical protein